MEKIIAVAMAALVSAVIWYLKHQAKAETEREKKHDEQQVKREEKHDKIQEEDRKFHRELITNHLEHLNNTSLKNTELNLHGIALQKEMMKDLKEHNSYEKVFQEKAIESIGLVCDRLNGGNTRMRIAKKNLKVMKEKN